MRASVHLRVCVHFRGLSSLQRALDETRVRLRGHRVEVHSLVGCLQDAVVNGKGEVHSNTASAREVKVQRRRRQVGAF